MGGRFAFLGNVRTMEVEGKAVNLNIPIASPRNVTAIAGIHPIRQFPTSRAVVSPRPRIKWERGIKLAIPPPSTLAAIKMPPSPPPPPPTVLETLLSFPSRPPPSPSCLQHQNCFSLDPCGGREGGRPRNTKTPPFSLPSRPRLSKWKLSLLVSRGGRKEENER